MATLEPGSGSRRSRGASPPETARCVGADGLDRRHPHRPAHREGRGHDRQEEPQGGAPEEDIGAGSRTIQEGSGKKPRSRSAIRASMSRPDPDPEHHPEQRRPGPRRAAGRNAMRAGRDPQGHADADLPALGLDDADREVERGEGRAEQDEDGEDVVEALIALDVVVEQAQDLVVLLGGDRVMPDVGERARPMAAVTCASTSSTVGAARADREHQVVACPGLVRQRAAPSRSARTARRSRRRARPGRRPRRSSRARAPCPRPRSPGRRSMRIVPVGGRSWSLGEVLVEQDHVAAPRRRPGSRSRPLDGLRAR